MSESAVRSRDVIVRAEGATLQHGPLSDRVYLMKPSPQPSHDLAVMERLADTHGYSKLFARVTPGALEAFRDAGFSVEARIPGSHDESVLFCSRFRDPARAHDARESEAEGVLNRARAAGMRKRVHDASSRGGVRDIDIRELDEDEIHQFAELYASTFESYPFPIDDPAFIAEEWRQGTIFVGAWESDRLLAAASAEPDETLATVEMTDFATREHARGLGLAGRLLERLGHQAIDRRARRAYTIARACSVGMNTVFARAGYSYAGRLINNTHIAGRIESMNVWYSPLEA